MTQVPKTTKGQAVLQPEMVLCLNCNQAMQVVESNSTEGKNGHVPSLVEKFDDPLQD